MVTRKCEGRTSHVSCLFVILFEREAAQHLAECHALRGVRVEEGVGPDERFHLGARERLV